MPLTKLVSSALTYIASIVVGLAAQQAERPDLIRSPKRVLAQTWEGFELGNVLPLISP